MIGTRVGPYEITAAIGAGGMGEVYRATDTKLKREVAIKVLPQAFIEDKERLARFEREAQLLAQLHHPNIASIFGLEESGESPALVMELVEGPTLADRVAKGPIPVEEALPIARQVAEALEYAHEHGIIHRDLKPANIKLTGDGEVKVLDFGLAKAMETGSGSAVGSGSVDLSHSPTMTLGGTVQGMILGTAGYMAPEQAAGKTVDKRADIWAFGVVLYEMLTGKRLFQGDSVPETLAGILKGEIDLDRLPDDVPSAMRRLLRRCLERNSKNRLHDIADARIVLNDLESGKSEEAVASGPPRATKRGGTVLRWVGLALLALIAGVGTAALLTHTRGGSSPEFRQLTFQRGTITAARFAPGGDTVVYSAAWGGRPSEIFTTQLSGPGSRSLGLTDASLLAVSRQGNLLVKLHPKLWANLFHGTLGQVPLGGGALREVMKSVQQAGWLPDGKGFLVVRMDRAKYRWVVQDSAGKVLYQSNEPRLTGVRISPDGEHVAVLATSTLGNSVANPILLLGAKGKARELAQGQTTGFAWSPSGKEIWYSQEDAGGASSLWAVDLSGRKRLLLREAGSLTLRDVSANGTLLVTADHLQRSVYFHSSAAKGERDLAWLDGSMAAAISNDGKMLLLGEFGTGGFLGAVYLRDTNGSPAVRLGDGIPAGLSPDGKWVLAIRSDRRGVMLIPTGPGQAREVPVADSVGQAWFFPHGNRLLLNVNLPDGKARLLSVNRDGNGLRQLAPDGFDSFIGEMPLSPNGKWFDAGSAELGQVRLEILPTDGSQRGREVKGFQPDDVVIRWSGDGRALYVFKRNQLPARVFRLDLATGTRTPWLTLMPADPAGVSRIPVIQMTPDGQTYAYDVARKLSDLYLVRGVR